MKGIACPRCAGSTDVKETRRIPGALRRRRRCVACIHSFSTVEYVTVPSANMTEPYALVPRRVLEALHYALGQVLEAAPPGSSVPRKEEVSDGG